MSVANSPKITWTYAGIEYETRLVITTSNPNPAEGVSINCVLNGWHNYDTTVKSSACGGINGFISEETNMLYSNNAFGAVGTKVRVRLFEGNVGAGEYHVFACCRVASISGGVNGTDNYLNVTLENYLEVQTFGLFGGIVAYSPTQRTIVKLVAK